jgi:integrase
MSRKNGPEPFYRADRNRWYVQLNGKHHNLGPNKDEAIRRWHHLMAAPPPVAAELVVGVVEGFLDWCQKNRAEGTYDWYRDHLESFCRSLPKADTFPVADLKPHHVTRWADSHPTWGPTQKRGAIGAVQRAFNWAEKVGHIDRNPVRHVEGKPTAKRRDLCINAVQFEEAIAHYPQNDPFRELLVFAWESGVRPQEARAIEARHFVENRQRLEIPPAEAKGKKRWRVIYLTDKAAEIVKRQAAKFPSGPIFRNEDGNPWTPDAINCRFCRLKGKIGYKLCSYVLRHSFCQRMLESGLDSVTVAALMGHANANMVSAVYSHMNKAKDYLAEQIKKAAG